jgi:hypothetical protein
MLGEEEERLTSSEELLLLGLRQRQGGEVDIDNSDNLTEAAEDVAALQPKRKKARKNPKMKVKVGDNVLDAVRDTFEYMCGFLDPTSLLQLSRAKQVWTLHSLGRTNTRLWRPAAELALCNAGIEATERGAVMLRAGTCKNYKTIVALYADRGCMECGKMRIRKVNLKFGWRFCEQCEHSSTISTYRLGKEGYSYPPGMLQDLQHTTAQLWSRWHGTYDVTFYSLRAIRSWLSRHGEPSLAEQKRIRDECAAMVAEEALVQRERKQLRADEHKRSLAESARLRTVRRLQIRALLADRLNVNNEEPGEDEAIWEEAIATLDASTNKFWNQPRDLTVRDRKRLADKLAKPLIDAYHATAVVRGERATTQALAEEAVQLRIDQLNLIKLQLRNQTSFEYECDAANFPSKNFGSTKLIFVL